MTDLFKTLQTIGAFDNYTQWIYSKIHPHLRGKVVDVGSGMGDIAKYYRHHDKVHSVWVTDSQELMLKELRNRFELLEKYKVSHLDVSVQLPQDIGLKADVVTCVNVLEHIEDDQLALNNMQSLLTNGGRIILFVPALPCIYGSLDKLVGHYRRYTKKSLVDLIQRADLKIIDLQYMNMLGVFSWFMVGKILCRQRFDSMLCSVLDKMVPFLNKLEDVFKPSLGQSLVVVCKKN